ncbi:MAG: tyrosine-type recombinase/integrase, partial [Bacteriovoracaceae bacterium]
GFLITNGYSPNTINRRLSTIRSFFKMAKMIGLVDYSIEVPNVKTKILRDTSGLKINEISKVFSNLKNLDSFKAARNYAIVRILFDLGFRATEVVTLDLCHLDLADKSVWVLGKGDTQRVKLSLPDQTCEALKEWIEARGDFEGPLFFALKADRTNLKRLTRQGLRDIVKSVAGEFGVPKKTTHSWRHSSITQAIVKTQENGLGLEVVLDHSRHSKNSIKLLMVYWDRLQNMQGKISSLVASQVFEYTDEDECA